MTNYSVKEESSRLWIDAETRQLRLRVSSISLDFAFDFELWSEPEWLKDRGTGSLSVFDCDISLGVMLGREAESGTLELDFTDVKIHTRDYNVELHGETDLSKAVQSMLVNFKVFFEEELTSLLASRLLRATRDVISEKLGIEVAAIQNDSSKEESPIEPDQIEKPKEKLSISKKLLVEPIFDSHYVAFVLDGTYEVYNIEKKKKFPKMPLFLPMPSDTADLLTKKLPKV